MFLDNHIGGVYYPAGGAQMLPNTIEKAFERDGGEVRYRTLVDEILIRDGRAYGVRLADGSELHADRIVANATVWNLYGKLVRPEHIAPERLAWAQGLVPTFPSLTLYLLVGREALPSDLLPWEVFIENRAEIDASDLTLYVNSLVDETLGSARDSWRSPRSRPTWAPGPRRAVPEYRDCRLPRRRSGRRPSACSSRSRSTIRAFARASAMIVGTPTTIERYLLKNGGAVGGPKNAIGQEMLKRLHARSEWKNLYVCGDSTVMATGAPAPRYLGRGRG